jgi:ubiquinone/menaquinone biosynthesis C-methylase UbiE
MIAATDTKATPARYLMDDPREAGRLQLKVDAREWAERFALPHLFAGAEVLCAGCGPGHLLRGAADIMPDISGTGVDLSRARLAEARQRSAEYPRLEFINGDLQRLPLPDDMFDVAWCRHLIEYLTRKELAVSELYRVLRPGGTVVLQDLDGQFVWHYPQDEELAPAIDRVMAALEPMGFDPFVGRKLYHLALTAGFKDIHVTVEPYHLYAGAIDDAQGALWALKLDILRPQLVKLLGLAGANDMISRFLDYLKRSDTLTYSMLFTVTGRK